MAQPQLRAPHRTGSTAPRQATALPAWPVLVLFHGFPLFWVLGALQFSAVALGLVMLGFLVVRRRVLVPGPAWLLAALVVWSAACVTQLPDAQALVGFGLRWAHVVASLLVLLYVANAGPGLSQRTVVSGLLTVWASLVLLGTLALVIPDVRITTPVGLLLPGSITSNELVRDFVFPPMAEVQHPWGAPEPYIRPAAPFPYANSWGVAFALLSPVALSALFTVRTRGRRLLLAAGLLLSVVPAVATSNRGMFLALGLGLGYAIVRLVWAGYWKAGLAGLAVLAGVAAWLAAGGAAARILARQLYSDSTGGRLALYRQTWDAALDAPLLGHGAPRLSESVGVYMGTQGYVWTILFSYGLVGLVLFLGYLWGSVWWTRGVRAPATIFLHATAVIAGLIIVVYGLDVMQTCVLVAVLGLLMRERLTGARP